MAALAHDWVRHGARFVPGDPKTIEVSWDRWREAAEQNPDAEVRTVAGQVRDNDAVAPLLTAVFSYSPYLTRCLIGEQDFACRLLIEGPDTACAGVVADIGRLAGSEPLSEADLMVRLRAAKRRIALAVALADIALAWPL